jgi:hypothetical protein
VTSPETYTHVRREDLPATNHEGNIGDETQPETQMVDFVPYVRELKKRPEIREWFILSMESSGLASVLEAEGIITPEPKNPNPIDPDNNEKQHELWWKEHSQEGEEFIRKNEERSHDLEMIAWGAMLERLLKKLDPHDKKG